MKSASKKKPEKIEYSADTEKYGSDGELTVKHFLEMLVSSEVAEFNQKVMNTSSDNPDKGYEYLDTVSVVGILSDEEIEERKASGKISFGAAYNRKIQDEKTALENALSCFRDGLVAVFADGKRYTEENEIIKLNEGSEVTLVRLSFLSGRMW